MSKFSLWILASGLFITVRNYWLSSFVLCCSDTVLATQQTAPAEQSNYCYMRCSSTARAIHLTSPVINKKSGRKLYSSHAWSWERRELSMSKFSLWLTYSTCKNAKRKPQQKKSMCQIHNSNVWDGTALRSKDLGYYVSNSVCMTPSSKTLSIEIIHGRN